MPLASERSWMLLAYSMDFFAAALRAPTLKAAARCCLREALMPAAACSTVVRQAPMPLLKSVLSVPRRKMRLKRPTAVKSLNRESLNQRKFAAGANDLRRPRHCAPRIHRKWRAIPADVDGGSSESDAIGGQHGFWSDFA